MTGLEAKKTRKLVFVKKPIPFFYCIVVLMNGSDCADLITDQYLLLYETWAR